jgi:GNAT superfamily N-acetyltransferase
MINSKKHTIVFDTANKDDIPELIRLRLAYIIDDYGSISESEHQAMEEILPDYFERRLGKELIAFVARAGGRLVAAAYLLIIEKPANPSMPNGLVGEVFSVFTEREYRCKGISTRLMNDMIAYAREKRLCHIDLKATDEGYSLYKKLGFEDTNQKYKDMRLNL